MAGLTASGRDSQATYLTASYGSVNPLVSRRRLGRFGGEGTDAPLPLLHRKADALPLDVDLEDAHLDLLTHADDLVGVLHVAIR